jgi:FkbM family methyltransferase
MFEGYIVSYAQNREDIILSAFFDADEIGFYVDVGANEPVHESVTKYFYDRNWSGINIEPLPHQYNKLVKERTRDINLQIGISDKEGVADLNYYPDGDGLSTLSQKMKDEYEQSPNEVTKNVEHISIKTYTLQKIFKEYINKKINFLKVDVEGLEYEVLIGNDWSRYRPEVICVEANHIETDWTEFLVKKEYTKVFFDGINNYYTDNNTDKSKKFDYVHGVIYKEPIINFRLIDYMKKKKIENLSLAAAKDSLELEIKALSNELREKESYELSLINEIDSMVPLRKHIKRQIRMIIIKLDNKIITRLSKEKKYYPTNLNLEIEPNMDAIHKYDENNFQKYITPPSKSILLILYIIVRSALKIIVKGIRG